MHIHNYQPWSSPLATASADLVNVQADLAGPIWRCPKMEVPGYPNSWIVYVGTSD